MKSKKGFSIIEAIIVIVVMGIVLTPFSILVVNVMQQNILSQAQATAVALAEGEMERLTGTRFSLLLDAAATSFPAPFSNYTHQTEVEYVNPTALNTPVVGPTDFKRVQAIVNNTISEAITLTTLVARDW